MSRVAVSRPAPAAPKRDLRVGGGATADEVCPICKSSRYLNNSLRFLVNPECYHKLCSSCVDRIFSHGPAPCPIPGCKRTLRKHRFREQTFEDIKVEREVDIRKKVAAVFNRREDEFETLRDYNDYLNEVEDITFNLINGIDLDETNKRFDAYRSAHEKEIESNAALAAQESQSFVEMQKLERQQARQRREAARREEEEERQEQEASRRDMLDALASGQDANHVQQVQLKKRMDRQAAAERQRQLQAADTRPSQSASNGSTGPSLIRGLKAKQKVEPEAPIDPFGGICVQPKYYTLQDDYAWELVQDTRNDPRISAGGYNVTDFSNRALCEAFSGLGVFIADEMTEKEKGKLQLETIAIATAGAADAA